MRRIFALVVLLATALAGCGQTTQVGVRPRLVTKVTADYKSGAIELHRQYTDEEKMRAVLNYLRCLEPYGDVSEEDITAGSEVKIVLTYSDGTTKTYDQRADQFLRTGNGAWQNIRSEQGSELPLLLGLMESD